MRIETLTENEKKFILNKVNKISLWKKEQIVYQWYETGNSNEYFEGKIKLIFDILNINVMAVRVEKIRSEKKNTEKKVYYLNKDDIDLYAFTNWPFIAKRRSINNNVFLDHFIKSNNKCKYLLEIENQNELENPDQTNDEYIILKDVTNNESYLNKNMAIPFTEADLLQLQFLIKLFQK